jgi:hypothetical protein
MPSQRMSFVVNCTEQSYCLTLHEQLPDGQPLITPFVQNLVYITHDQRSMACASVQLHLLRWRSPHGIHRPAGVMRQGGEFRRQAALQLSAWLHSCRQVLQGLRRMARPND